MAGTVAVVGRDPASDLVLNDPKCSRKHAVVEAGPDGISVRDNGSANGVFVNGHKAERARIRDGDTIKLGDVLVTLLPEGIPGTMIMDGVDGLAEAAEADPVAPPPLPAVPWSGRTVPEIPVAAAAVRSPPPPLPPRSGARASRPDPGAVTVPPPAAATRPLTATVLAVLWALSVPLYVVLGLLLSRGAGGARTPILVAGIVLAVVSAAMAAGLWGLRRWAYRAQLVVAGVGIFLCPFTLASIAVLVYLLQPDAKAAFTEDAAGRPQGGTETEPMFAGALVATVVLGVILSGGLAWLMRTAGTMPGGPARLLTRAPAAERAAVARLKAMAAAQDAFRSVCNTGYGDLQALRSPATVIPEYPADGPAFLRDAGFDQAEAGGYRYALSVEEEMPPAAGCPTRRYRRYLYRADPLGAGRSLAVGPDGMVRAAQGRPATATDPAAE